ncbi:MAG TPA: UDP-glucose/GDP-mannose dehydrogenase family protein, partial [Archaeoglobaceae archaeon]|nr:UDP-glucose/GDP-mannose dehydrogenase family protein [Archaeoglobaceae archaeon]
MRISVIGSGYVGIVTGIGFAELKNSIIFVDIDKDKIDTINSGKPPIYERGLEELMKRNKERYHATEDYREILKTELTFMCISTPSNADGSINLDFVKSASQSIGEVLKEKDDFHTVVVKSTVIPGTTEEVIKPLIENASNRKASKDFGIAMNPEFLREGSAVEDFFNPDRIVIGVEDEKSKEILLELYSKFKCENMITDIKSAEMIKYASNSFLATKISFANEIGNICKRLGIDAYEVFKGVGLDHRINPSFFRAGIGFGGSCFPKDVKALVAKAEELDEHPEILKAVLKVNEKQPLKLIELLKKHIPDLKDKKIGILG